jgi:hypothetical protein
MKKKHPLHRPVCLQLARNAPEGCKGRHGTKVGIAALLGDLQKCLEHLIRGHMKLTEHT